MRQFEEDHAVDYYSDDGYGSDTSGAGQRARAEPAEEAQYDVHTGAPINMTAKQEVVRDWNTAAVTGEKARVVNLPYEELERATDRFSAFNMVGGGASCAVFRCFLFGTIVAIKQLKDATVEWETKQFENEMERHQIFNPEKQFQQFLEQDCSEELVLGLFRSGGRAR